MSTLSIHQRSTHFIAAGAAGAALAAAALVFALSDDSGNSSAPAQHSPASVHQDAPRHYHHQPTTVGGHVMTGL